MDFNFITDTPKTNIEMLLNHIYAKSGKVCIRTFEKFECDFEMCCVGLFYRAAIEAAEMREKLKKELASRNIQNKKELQ